MENKNFSITLKSNQPPKKVFQAVTNVRAWWFGYYDEEIIGDTEKLNDEFSFSAGNGVHFTKHKLIEVVPNEKIVWLVTESNLNFIAKKDEWTGSKVIFELTQKDGEILLTFTHEGLTPEIECYTSCAPVWTMYLQEKLGPMINENS